MFGSARLGQDVVFEICFAIKFAFGSTICDLLLVICVTLRKLFQ